MASDKEYVRYVLEQLSGLEEISTRAMMGEYILYYRGKVAGGIYDNRLLIKPVAAAVAQFENPIYEIPYPGAREMLLVDRLFLGNAAVTPLVCLVVCLTILFVVVFAKCVGCSLPLLAEKVGLDPAVMASPFISTIVDATSLLIYFSFASALLGI